VVDALGEVSRAAVGSEHMLPTMVKAVFAGWLIWRMAQEDAVAASPWNPFAWRTPDPAAARQG